MGEPIANWAKSIGYHSQKKQRLRSRWKKVITVLPSRAPYILRNYGSVYIPPVHAGILPPISPAHEIANLPTPRALCYCLFYCATNLPYPTSKRLYCHLGIRWWLPSPATKVETLQNRLCLVESVLGLLFFPRLPTCLIYTQAWLLHGGLLGPRRPPPFFS